MNLYKISQDMNDGYDTYDSAVVAAETEQEAQMIHPDGRLDWNGKGETRWGSWTNVENVKIQHIGIADSWIEKGVIMSSFNAG